MTSSDRDSYSHYRIEKAEEAYKAAELLVVNGQWNAAVNRLYYAAYYAISGLLATDVLPLVKPVRDLIDAVVMEINYPDL